MANKIVFVGSDDPTESHTCEVFGLSFRRDEPVAVDGEVEAKLVKNPMFRVVTGRGAKD